MYKNYFELINSVEVDTYIKFLEEIAWFSQMTKDVKKQKEKKIKESYKNNKKYTFNNLYDLAFDAEGVGSPDGNNITGYPKIIKEFSNASFGTFNPSNIREDGQPGEVIISFRHKEKTYNMMIEDTEWYENSFTVLINRVLKEAGINQEFIKLPDTDQSVFYCFISKEIYQKALDKKLVPAQSEVDIYLNS